MKVNFAIILCSICTFSNLLFAQDIRKRDSLISILNDVQEDKAKFEVLSGIAFYSSRPDEIIDFGKQALNFASRFNNHYWIGRSYIHIGHGYKKKGEYDKGLDAYFDALKHFELDNNYPTIANAYNSIAQIYVHNGDLKKAKLFYKKAIKLRVEKKNTLRLGEDYLNLGELYRIERDTDSSLFYFRKSIDYFIKSSRKIGIAYANGNIGLVHAAQNKNDSAEHYINQATEILEELGDRYPIAVYQTYMADIYKDKGDWEMALKYAHQSLQIAEEEGLKEQIRDASLKLSELYRDEGEFKKAYEYQNRYIIYRDSINNEDVIRKMADLRTEYEVSKKQIEVDLLAQRSKTQSIVNYGLAIIVLLLIILAVIIYQHGQKRKQVNQVLSDQKEEIEAQRDKLEELVNMKDRFFGIISHDLRSPVNSLQGITQLLAYYVKGRQIDQIEEFVSLADKSINNLSSLLDNLLSWALSQQGSLPYRPEKFQFYYVAEEVRRIFANSAASKNIELQVDVPKEIEIYADRDSIFAMVRNLINNAIKFTLEKGTVTLIAENGTDSAKITVCDTGVGIPQDKIKQLFEFDKGKSTKGTAGEKGSGLGLALCKDIVNLNDGKIEVESKEGKGTTFVIYLPVDEAG